MAEPIIVIPARMVAERLPGKPLLDICGVPLVVHVWRRAREAELGPVLVATDTPEIARAVESAGGKAILTRAEHASGSDRVFEAVTAADADGRHDIVINLQADMPEITSRTVRAAVLPLADRAVDIGTVATKIGEPDLSKDPAVVKLIGTSIGENRLRALYFTRAVAPWGEGDLLQHIGVYAFRRSALARFAALPRSALERRERLEQLRALEAGMRIDVALVNEAPIGVDTPADLQRARAYFEGKIKS
ncbi:MAG: 3-deoxy-manno-octulosonate cytidylyltransferase [Methylobacteriaceae bacterium]|nr:3-deoxy-manno-octulosonate cytidylyltransferase [Methylobacteriaceae bacterium]